MACAVTSPPGPPFAVLIADTSPQDRHDSELPSSAWPTIRSTLRRRETSTMSSRKPTGRHIGSESRSMTGSNAESRSPCRRRSAKLEKIEKLRVEVRSWTCNLALQVHERRHRCLRVAFTLLERPSPLRCSRGLLRFPRDH